MFLPTSYMLPSKEGGAANHMGKSLTPSELGRVSWRVGFALKAGTRLHAFFSALTRTCIGKDSVAPLLPPFVQELLLGQGWSLPFASRPGVTLALLGFLGLSDLLISPWNRWQLGKNSCCLLSRLDSLNFWT